MEIWKKIKDFEDYEISNLGNVKNIKRNRILRLYERKGYFLVYLYNKNGRKTKLVHRLVANAFIPNLNNYPQINHKDENSLNNNVNNLEWCSAKYNSNYGTHKEKLSIANKGIKNHFYGKKHSQESIEKMRKAKIGKPNKNKRKIIIDDVEYDSITQAMKQLNISTTKIYKILKEGK